VTAAALPSTAARTRISPPRGELHRLAQQIVEHLPDSVAAGLDPRLAHPLQNEVVVGGHRAEALHCNGADLAERERLPPKLQPPGGEAGAVEQVLDQAGETVGALDDRPQGAREHRWTGRPATCRGAERSRAGSSPPS
jgi:hypothetical protein